MPEEQKTSFKVLLECGNCGHEWSKPVRPGRKVLERSWTRNRVKIGDESPTGGIEGEIEWVDCPVCETHSEVDVTGREPI